MEWELWFFKTVFEQQVFSGYIWQLFQSHCHLIQHQFRNSEKKLKNHYRPLLVHFCLNSLRGKNQSELSVIVIYDFPHEIRRNLNYLKLNIFDKSYCMENCLIIMNFERRAKGYFERSWYIRQSIMTSYRHKNVAYMCIGNFSYKDISELARTVFSCAVHEKFSFEG